MGGGGTYVLYEAASGYGLFEIVEAEAVGSLLAQVQEAVLDAKKFCSIVKLKAFQPFSTAENALENMMNVSEGVCHDDLKNFLETNLPSVKKAKKKSKLTLGVSAPNIGTSIQESVGFPCSSNETILEIIRGVRCHFQKYVKALSGGLAERAQLGLGHSYSRAKVKFNVNRQDNMIIQAICLLDQIDKDLNTCAMRVREWYSWHFPELNKIVSDAFIFARVVHYIGARNTLNEERLAGLTEITLDEDLTQAIMNACKSSMGMDVSEIDMLNIKQFALRVVNLGKYRKQLHEYLQSKMAICAPNLSALIGEMVASRLISHAGSLTNLAKCPASTVQILGAEKALFRALKTKGNTPKYGLIFHSSFIGRANAKNKGRISRYLANKCSIAARIDSFSDEPNDAYGIKLKEQVEERLKFYETGETPRKNIDVMEEVARGLKAQLKEAGVEEEESEGDEKKEKKKKKKKSKKRKAESADSAEEPTKKKKKKKKKKDKSA